MQLPDLHTLLEEPNNATPAIWIKAVIDLPHITDFYLITRLEEFNKHWLHHVMDAKWKWLPYQWQGLGSIHGHGCAKLKHDPGHCDLVKAAAHGWKLQKMLDVEKIEHNYEEMIHDFTPAIEAGVQAQARVVQYAEWLLTTMNDSLPEENWTVPNPHPCARRLQEAANEDDDYHSLANSVQRHTRCSAAYYLRIKPGTKRKHRANHFHKVFII